MATQWWNIRRNRSAELEERVWRRLSAVVLSLAVVIAGAALAAGDESSSGEQANVVLTEYSPLATVGELLDRLFSPLRARHVREAASQANQSLTGRPIDLAHERFSVFVPEGAPPAKGYGLLVFIPPWEDASAPNGWTAALAQRKIIFVAAANSGNDEDVFDRRIPLALLGAHNMMKRYPIDADRLYIGGFSGGSRIALRVAIAFPDLFRGALLNAGSDPLGDELIPLPDAARFEQFRTRTRLVMVTGQHDDVNLGMDSQSQDSMEQWCVFGFKSETMPFLAHDPARVSSLNRALDFLDQPLSLDSQKLAACEQRVDHQIDQRFAEVETDLANGKRRQALDRLNAIDLHYGGLAAPRSLDLQKKIEAPPS